MTLWDFIISQVHTNQFLSAALIAAPATAIGYTLRTIPAKVWEQAKTWTTLRLRFNSDQANYQEALAFATRRLVSDRWTRDYNYEVESSYGFDDDEKSITRRGLSIGYGRHIGWFRGHLVLVNRSQEEGSQTKAFKEHMVITLLSRTKAPMDWLYEAIAAFADELRQGEERLTLKVNCGTYWSNAGKLPMRGIGTVISANDAAKRVVNHILAFDDRAAWDHAKGLPHHTGILLHGKPGNGKSSLIHAVASATKRSISYLSLASIEKDRELTELLGGSMDWAKTLLVIEDFDSHGLDLNRDKTDDEPGKADAKEKKEAVSLSTILNALDGLLSPDGLVVIATTNHIDRLDEALRRPGRFDLTIEVGPLGRREFETMQQLLEVGGRYALPYFQPMTGAEMRSRLLRGGVEAIEDWQRENA